MPGAGGKGQLQVLPHASVEAHTPGISTDDMHLETGVCGGWMDVSA